MYGNIYVSGLIGSDATPPPAASSSATTRTHNLPQPHFPSGTVATAALHNHRDDPHLAGNEACLCSSCHIKDRFFPRSLDGRIVLPPPLMSAHSTRHPRPMTSASAAPTTPGLAATHRRTRTDSTASNRDLRLSVAKFNEGRRGAGPRTPYLQSDNGEGSSAANIGESLPYGNRATDEFLHAPQQMSRPDQLEGRPFSGPSRRTQQSKRHDHKPKRPDPSPRILESEEFLSQPSHLSQQPSSSQHKSRRTRLESFLDKHGTAHPPNILQTPRARELSPQMARLETPGSTTPLATDIDYEHRSISSPHPDIFDVNVSRYPETPGHRETFQYHSRHHSASQSESDIAQDKPRIITFSSRSENPQPDNHTSAPTTSGEGSVHSSPRREPAPLASHLWQIEAGSSSQTQFQFQEPVVPEADPTSPIRLRELSTVQVKWDSERKRRQGYFAQEEGTEKSPFRHYNKANCDFED